MRRLVGVGVGLGVTAAMAILLLRPASEISNDTISQGTPDRQSPVSPAERSGRPVAASGRSPIESLQAAVFGEATAIETAQGTSTARVAIPEPIGPSLAAERQGYRVEAGPAGVVVRSIDGQGWQVALGGEPRVVRQTRDGLTIERDYGQEWYRLRPDGIEQGFVIDARPNADGPLVLPVSVDGLRARTARQRA